MKRKNIKYFIVSPVRNESVHIRKTLDSVTSQTIKPMEWVIVDDGSSDGTREIVREYSARFDWIRLVNRTDRGFAEPGRGVVEAFYEGYNKGTQGDFDFVVKLDGDLSFPPDYFERLFERFEKNPRLGMASGVCHIEVNGRWVPEKHPDFHVRGPSKVYRKKCWEDIGGLVPHLGWDTIDEIKARYYGGWETRSFKDLRIKHHRVTGHNTGAFRWAIKLGMSNYYCGYSPLFILAKGIRRIFVSRPRVLGGLGVMFGYFWCYLAGAERYGDDDLIRYIRREQVKRLLFQKGLWD